MSNMWRYFEKFLESFERSWNFSLSSSPVNQVPVLTHESCTELQEFVRRVVYSGKKGETYVETRIRIYEKMKNMLYSTSPLSDGGGGKEEE